MGIRIWAGAFIAAIWLFAGAALAQDVVTVVEYREAFIERVQKAIPGVKIVRKGDTEIEVTPPGTPPLFVSVAASYRYYSTHPDDYAGGLDRLVRNMQMSLDPPKMQAGQMVIIVRNRAYLEASERGPVGDFGGGTVGGELVSKPLAGDMVMILAEDHPEAIRLPRKADVRREVGEVDKVWGQALARTPDKIGELSVEPVRKGVFLASGDAGFAPSLLAPGLWDRPELKGKGDPVVLVLDRDNILFAWTGDPGAVDRMVALVTEMRGKGEEFLSRDFLVRDGEGWRVLER